MIKVKKIISGGQTGVDQAALDAAINCGIAYGGWLPGGRKTEAGPLSSKYIMDEMVSSAYPDRTRKNVEAADATVIISKGLLSGGSMLTHTLAVSLDKPCLHIDLLGCDVVQRARAAAGWIEDNSFATVNFAGPRLSSDTSIYASAYELIVKIIENTASLNTSER